MPLARILIVDDESDVKSVMKRGLEISGFEVTAECDPLQALANFKVATYNLALLDIRMPNMDGFDLFDKLSKMEGNLKVCFLTAFDIDYFERFKERFPNIPTRCFIKKPVSIRNLISMVRAELGLQNNSNSSSMPAS